MLGKYSSSADWAEAGSVDWLNALGHAVAFLVNDCPGSALGVLALSTVDVLGDKLDKPLSGQAGVSQVVHWDAVHSIPEVNKLIF